MEIKVRNLSIHYEIIGEGKPIIMLHGYSVDYRLMSGCMEPVFNKRTGYKRIYIDLPGMGRSQSEEWIKNSDSMLDIVLDFIEAVIPSENFLLAGESYGGYLSRGLIYKMADRIDGLLLICPCIEPDNKKRNIPTHIVLKREEGVLSRVDAEEAEGFNSMHVVQNERIWQRYRDEILVGIKEGNKNFLSHFKKTGYGFSFDVDKMERQYEKPTLMLLGRQDSSVGYKDSWEILDNYPRATFVTVDMAGHNLQLEQEEVFNCLVNEWLNRIEK